MSQRTSLIAMPHPRRRDTWLFTLMNGLRQKTEEFKAAISKADPGADIEEHYDSYPIVEVRTRHRDRVLDTAAEFDAVHNATEDLSFASV